MSLAQSDIRSQTILRGYIDILAIDMSRRIARFNFSDPDAPSALTDGVADPDGRPMLFPPLRRLPAFSASPAAAKTLNSHTRRPLFCDESDSGCLAQDDARAGLEAAQAAMAGVDDSDSAPPSSAACLNSCVRSYHTLTYDALPPWCVRRSGGPRSG